MDGWSADRARYTKGDHSQDHTMMSLVFRSTLFPPLPPQLQF